MNFIKGWCRTNLDDYDCSDISLFVAVPRKGDMVRVMYKGNATSLKVVGVTHRQRDECPYIEIELNR